MRSSAARGSGIVKTPVRAPQANAIAERFVPTVRSDCLDWLLILNRRHLDRVLRVYVDDYNRERPHRAHDLRPPEPAERRAKDHPRTIHRRDRLGGLIPEYHRAAARGATRIMAPFRDVRAPIGSRVWLGSGRSSPTVR